mmetsp:Transcript_174042/g.557979  ORF Transcript_174042/g.557979 Transcript_174042/m.557979 type:complete len:568 (-) Transcript_174042:2979-4682(-)
MHEQALIEAPAGLQALELRAAVAAVAVPNRADHDQLRIGVCLKQPLRDIRDVIHTLLLHPTPEEDEHPCFGVLVQAVLLLYDHLRVRLGSLTAAISQHPPRAGTLGLRHAVLDAPHLGQAPKHGMLQGRLQGVVPRHSADPVSTLIALDVINDRLQHAELTLDEGFVHDALHGKVEDVCEMPGLRSSHVLCRDGALVLCVVQHQEHRERPLDVHHRHGSVEVGTVECVGRLQVYNARDCLGPQRVQFQGPAGGLGCGVDVLASPEKGMVHEVVRDGRAGLTITVCRNLVLPDMLLSRLVPQDVAGQGRSAHSRMNLADGNCKAAVVALRHACRDADKSARMVLAHQAGNLAQATGHGLLAAVLVLDDVLQGGEEHAVRPHDRHLLMVGNVDTFRRRCFGGRGRCQLLRQIPRPLAAALSHLLGGEAHLHHAVVALLLDAHGGDDERDEIPQHTHDLGNEQCANHWAGRCHLHGSRRAQAKVGGHGVVQQKIVEQDTAGSVHTCRLLHVPRLPTAATRSASTHAARAVVEGEGILVVVWGRAAPAVVLQPRVLVALPRCIRICRRQLR